MVNWNGEIMAGSAEYRVERKHKNTLLQCIQNPTFNSKKVGVLSRPDRVMRAESTDWRQDPF